MAAWLKTFPATLHLTPAGHEVYVFGARELPGNLPCGSAGALVILVLVGYAASSQTWKADLLQISSDRATEFAGGHEVCPWEATGTATSSSLIQAGGVGRISWIPCCFDDIPLNGSMGAVEGATIPNL